MEVETVLPQAFLRIELETRMFAGAHYRQSLLGSEQLISGK